jgi:raffinose/stachyose/melibiose transport system substrate-binding protein
VLLSSFSTFAGNDGNAANYQQALKTWEVATGGIVSDISAQADETVKGRIRTDFSTGSEPDVLFYFTGADADTFLDKVVPISEIREEFPDFAANMKEDAVALATDGNWYAVPVNGYWENFFVNKKVLSDSGVAIPPKEYSWHQFLADCQKIKEAGFIPIAASFVDVPHYWWEFAIFNNTSPKTHQAIPKNIDDDAAKAWIAGMKDILQVSKHGFFPPNITSEKDENIQELFYTNKAAFLLDGSWRANTIKGRASTAAGIVVDPAAIENYTVANFPSKNLGRSATDMIGGMSSGWYITRKGWESKKALAVSFVSFMTSDEMVSKFTGTGSNALKTGAILDEAALDSLDIDVIASIKAAASFTPAVQDTIAGDARNAMFQAMPKLLSEAVTPEELVANFIASFS